MRKLNLIVVDDEELCLTIFVEYLKIIEEKLGIDIIVKTFMDGNDALEYFMKLENSSIIDCIFIDVQMPIMNGYEATLFIRTKNENIPIIAVTGYDKIKYEELFSNVIFKPVTIDNLEKIIMQIMNNDEALYNLFNFSIIKSLKSVGKNKVKLILDKWKNSVDDKVNEIEELIKNKGFSNARLLINSLKGNCQQIGCSKITAILKKIALTIENSDSDRIFEALNRARFFIEKTKVNLYKVYDLHIE